ncbi:MAG: class I SAM-dependent methyltransferase, partial [Deltaproteobacteria bacterium]|nr:class I SAM-dependent methyltransferase [Deltaproteobacteria bacterium]
YDGQRRRVIPCFDDFYRTAVDMIPFDPEDAFTVLDLGAGTGLLSALILGRFPKAGITLLDFSEKMLEKARERFQTKKGVRFCTLDYARSPLPRHFHLVVSAMSIHHLTDADKRGLFQGIYEALLPEGHFIHAELVRGATDFSEAVHRRVWLGHLERTGLTEEQVSVILERMTYDKTAPLEAQLTWLREAGFADVDCYFKYHNFAVYTGRKLET